VTTIDHTLTTNDNIRPQLTTSGQGGRI